MTDKQADYPGQKIGKPQGQDGQGIRAAQVKRRIEYDR
jgi:hypothetical protein